MTMFGLEETVVTPLMAAVTSDDASGDVDERFARASWTGIVEPGDRLAGVFVGAVGAANALKAVIERWSVDRVRTAITDAGGDDENGEEVATALARWQPRLVSGPTISALRLAARIGARLAIPGDPGWPEGLADLGVYAPMALWVRGNHSTFAAVSNSIALVGARAATGYGEGITMEASAGLVDRGIAIVSGAAYGIDGMAHRAALASSGQTMAILAGGVDRFYPSGHDALLARIVESGVVISELPCGSAPTKWRFLQRNRLIAAVSQATVVMEAGWRSGSLNTAGHAATLGRPLGAVPGPVTSAMSAGCHRLIRDFGATCVTNSDEMAELMPHFTVSDESPSTPVGAGYSTDEIRVLDALSARSPRDVDDVARRAGLAVASVKAVFGTLEIDGIIAQRERGWVKGSHQSARR
ncbi:DNA-processing protein DprA [Parafrigoribacterium mesophilum]|uniref:DNA-processing protein DprA n=1 Tax=Parafrigoribacterium mesophilum TaxID=433646 RepID=UPI0031FBB11B